MMPGYETTNAEFAATDCLICHSAEGILDFDALGYSPERAQALRCMGF
jgi:hypothetical protein